MRAFLVSHSHWDREWYRTFQDFRARLVDLVDRVLDLCASDPGFCFMLDGQTVILEDYLEVRPGRAEELRARCAESRLALGPWYVQPDSLLPSGEAHVRNLLIGRSVGETVGAVSRAGYTPDSFGHPAQFPQILVGFGIASFVYWRGNGIEIEALPAEYDWVAPDGSRVTACHLGKGYFCAATSPGADLEKSWRVIADRARELAERTSSGAILLLNGIDHAMPDSRTEALADGIARSTGFEVQRALLDEFVEAILGSTSDRAHFRGELVGARVAPLLPGVWSTRTWIKRANRTAEAALEGWAEPFAALGQVFGLPSEAPALRLAWKELLKNQAHDSICGCSRDEVHEQMRARFDTARELADQTARRCLERLAGLGVERLRRGAMSSTWSSRTRLRESGRTWFDSRWISILSWCRTRIPLERCIPPCSGISRRWLSPWTGSRPVWCPQRSVDSSCSPIAHASIWSSLPRTYRRSASGGFGYGVRRRTLGGPTKSRRSRLATARHRSV